MKTWILVMWFLYEKSVVDITFLSQAECLQRAEQIVKKHEPFGGQVGYECVMRSPE